MNDHTTSIAQKNKPVILQVLPELEAGGVERGTVDIVKAGVADGFEMLVASSGGRLVHPIEQAGGVHITLPFNSKKSYDVFFKNASKLVKLIEKYQVDIVHARSRAPAWSAYKACRKTGAAFVTTFHGIYSHQNAFKRYYNSVMLKGCRVIVGTEFAREHIREVYKREDDETFALIHRGVDIDYFSLAKVSKERLVNMAKALNIQYDCPIILLPGRITSWKGHSQLLEALRPIDEQFICLFAGDRTKHPDYVRRLRNQISEYGLQQKVSMVDHQQDMPTLYSIADIVISASTRAESFGRVMAEAQAMERLVIATNIGGSRETVINEKTGRLVDVGDTQAMTQAITDMLTISDSKRKALTRASRQHIEKNFTLASMQKQTLALYRSILKETKPETKLVSEEASPAISYSK